MKLGIQKTEDNKYEWKLYPRSEQSDESKNLYFAICQPRDVLQKSCFQISKDEDDFLGLVDIPTFDGYFDQMSYNFLKDLIKVTNSALPLKLNKIYEVKTQSYNCQFNLSHKRNDIILDELVKLYNLPEYNVEKITKEDPGKLFDDFEFLRYASILEKGSLKETKVSIFYSKNLFVVLFLIKEISSDL